MRVEFASAELDRLETDSGFDMGLSQALVGMFRRRLQFIRDAADERDFYSLKSLHFEKLKGKRKTQHSLRLNDQFRLVLELKGTGREKYVLIIAVVDYH